MARRAKPPGSKSVEALRHEEARRRNIPTAEYQSVIQKEAEQPLRVAYERRNRDLDPQLVWRGKDQQDWSDLVVQAPPLYIQEKVHPKALIDDLLRQTRERRQEAGAETLDLFADFNGIPAGVDRTEFYQHDQNWSNRMILGDSLQVMASLAEREGLRGKVQCIYIDPPYGIKFNSNFQWSTTSRDVKDGNAAHITREPEQVKAFRDTWRDGIHSYLTYLRDRLTVARDLLTESGSIFVQIGDENVHRVRALMDEVFGEDNCVIEIVVKKKGSQKSSLLDPVNDFILWYSRSPRHLGVTKFRPLFDRRELDSETVDEFSRAELASGTFVSLKNHTTSDGERLDLFGNPARSFYANEVIRLARCGTGAVQRELARLEAAGLVTVTPIGRQKHYQANSASSVFGEVRALMLKTSGLADVLREALRAVAHEIRAAFVYGSVAKEEDNASSDIELLVVSDRLSCADLFEALEAAASRLGRKVAPTIYSRQELAARSKEHNAFVTRVLQQPKVWVIGSERDLAA